MLRLLQQAVVAAVATLALAAASAHAAGPSDPAAAAARVREYTFTVGFVTMPIVNGRGAERNLPFVAVNGAVSGPAIHVARGETLAVTIINELHEGTSIHWHGFEQHGSNEYDGVVDVTQCEIARGRSFTYRFVVNEIPGTYWWHTHHTAQMGGENYIKGPLIVHAPDTPDSFIAPLTPMPTTGAYAYGNERIIFAGEYWEYTELMNLVRFEQVRRDADTHTYAHMHTHTVCDEARSVSHVTPLCVVGSFSHAHAHPHFLSCTTCCLSLRHSLFLRRATVWPSPMTGGAVWSTEK
jgi:FtsP/CotA-like multicopper oxidase with cupredoxin domain